MCPDVIIRYMKLFGRKKLETISSVYVTPTMLRVVELRLINGRPVVVRADAQAVPGATNMATEVHTAGFSDLVAQFVRSTDFLAVHAMDEVCIGGVCEVPTNHLQSPKLYQGVFANHISARGYDPRGFICDVSVIESNPAGIHVSWIAYPNEHQSVIMNSRPADEGFAMDRTQRHLFRFYDIPIGVPFVWVSLEGSLFHAVIMCGDAILDEVLVQTGSRELLDSIQAHLKCDRHFATEVLRRHGMLRTHHDGELQAKLAGVAQQWVKAMVNMITVWRTSAYRPNYARVPIEIMVSAGMLSEIPGMESLIAQQAGLSVWRRVHPDVVQLIQRSPQIISRSTIGRYAAPLAHAMHVIHTE